jgi:hypothetical protein
VKGKYSNQNINPRVEEIKKLPFDFKNRAPPNPK